MKKNCITGFLLLTLSLTTYAQKNLDSLYNTFLESRGIGGKTKTQNEVQTTQRDVKCGFGISADIRTNFNLFTPDQQIILSTLMERRDDLHKSSVSPSKIFRIHYDTTGINAPKYFTVFGMSDAEIVKMSVDSLAAALDKSYDYEVNYLGYAPPPKDGIKGGDDKYDIYLLNLGDYGATTLDNGSNSSFIIIENDFIGSFYTHGIDAAKVTAAHEFHHALQLGAYGFFDTERVLHELTSSAMEEFVYDEINDYYSFIPDYFNKTFNSLKQFSGYQLPVFYFYLQQKFARTGDPMKGHKIIKRAWEILKIKGNAVEALSLALFENGMSLKNAWNEFGIWCYFTSSRTKPGEYFEEANNYPLVRQFSAYKYDPPHKEYSLSTSPISNNFLFFEITTSSFKDTLVSLITNADIENGKSSPFSKTESLYTLATSNETGTKKIVNQYYSKLETTFPDLFVESNIFNNEEVRGSEINREVLDFAFPQPFVYSNNSSIFIPAEPNILEIADLNIYTTGMNLVYSSSKDIIAGEKIVVRWNGMDDSGHRLPTGIYIYVTKSGDKIKKGKIVIYNE
ncbi:MAG: hypothetical protein KKB34_09940 [Bacteroidetes bacterium]|nr:hypothetical protein [Bacteroidota bacterium]